MNTDQLFESLRDAVNERVWSGGVRLARAGSVQGVSADDDEIVLHITLARRSEPYEVTLWPDDADWSCDCGHEEGCAHAVAGILAVRQANKDGEILVRATGEIKPVALPKAKGIGSLRYRLTTQDKNLLIERLLVRGKQITVLHGSIRQVQGVTARGPDLEIDDVVRLGTRELPAAGWHRILRALGDGDCNVTLDGAPIQISDELITPVVIVRDHGHGFVLTLHRNSRVSHAYRGGVVRVDGALHPYSGGGLAPHERRTLVKGIVYEPKDAAKLVSRVLPGLEERVTVKRKTERLPSATLEPPRLMLELKSGPKGLDARLDLVYGEPPVARVEWGELVLLGGRIPLRDIPMERRLMREAEQLKLPVGRPWSLPPEDAIRFVQRRLGDFEGQIKGDVSQFKVRKEPARIGLSADGKRVQGDVDPARLLAAWDAGERIVSLLGGGYAPLPIELLEAHGHLIADLVAASGNSTEVPTHALPLAGALARALDQPPPVDLEGLRPLLEDFNGLPDVALPGGLNATLRPYQEVGYRWLRFLCSAGLGGILADDMGLGKTLQALCAIRAVGGHALVVAPTSVLDNWRRETERFLPGVRVSVFHGPRRQLDETADIVVTSYALMRLDDRIRARNWTTVVLDEAQAIKNPQSQTAQAAFKLVAKHRFSLTGTPIENRLEELWSQLHFCMPGFLGGRRDFRERYAKPVEAGDPRATQALRARIGPFVLRRRKQQVATDLPSRTDVVLSCPLPANQRQVYDMVAQAGRDDVAQLLGDGRALKVLELLLRMRQAACHPALLPGDQPHESGKLEVLVEKLLQVTSQGSKALVFSQWTGFLDLIQEAVETAGLAYCRLDGSTRQRQSVVDRFQSDDGPPVFLISLKAGGTGLNLTQADYVFHTDPWWNPAVEDQATDRAHRIGQTRPVVSVKLISEGTVEEGIVALQERKRQLAIAALEGDADFISKLSRDDLMSLFA